MSQPQSTIAHSPRREHAVPTPPVPQDGGQQGRARPVEFQPRHLDGELMNALVVEDSPQIAERLVELVSVPSRVEVVATAATEDEALAACDRYTIGLAIVDLQLAQGTGFGVIRRLRAAAGSSASPSIKASGFSAPSPSTRASSGRSTTNARSRRAIARTTS